ncbi:MAG: hypothetical protein IT563_16280 [Alphaproteobacteria bacterium]|nr:hypothetical protein [Alphaproteobacteria bacterium]
MRPAVMAVTLALALVAGHAQAQSRSPMVMDPYAYHPQRLAPGTAEYDFAVRQRAPIAKHAEPRALEQALAACNARYGTLSPATREKCEIKIRQQATAP